MAAKPRRVPGELGRLRLEAWKEVAKDRKVVDMGLGGKPWVIRSRTFS